MTNVGYWFLASITFFSFDHPVAGFVCLFVSLWVTD